MPQLNTSDGVKERVGYLLERLLAYANDQLPEYEHFRNKLIVRWLDENGDSPKLIVKTELRFLAELVTQQQSEKSKETIKHDLHVLKRFLEILEDNRTKTQGSANWHFTLRLWHRSTEINLREFRQAWAQRKLLNSKRSPVQELENTFNLNPSYPSLVTATDPIPSLPALFHTLPHLNPTTVVTPPEAEPSNTTQRIVSQAGHTYPHHNLPAGDHTQFMGRQDQFSRLLKLLSSDHPARISVEGIGGIGKTSLVLEAAQHCLRFSHDAPLNPATSAFDAIIYTSAKPYHLTTRGILPRFRQERTLLQIFRSIAHTLGYPDIASRNFDDQLEQLQTLLVRQSVLLIVDNLETIETQQDVLAFLYDLPSTVKVVITSCERAVMDVSIRLEPLPQNEGIRLIEHQAETKDVQLSYEEAQTLYQATGGIPAAIVYAIGQLANGYLFTDVLPRLTLAESDFCRFYFEQSVKPLRGQPAHPLLMALALFPKSASREAVAQVALADLDPTAGLARLHQLSLVTLREGRYTMLPLTREYALAELKFNLEFEPAARQRWVNWHLKFVEQHGSQNWREWQEYTLLDREWENVQAAIEWCIEQGWYEEFNQFWQFVKGYTHLYGYWNERLIWMDWWCNAAQQRSDNPIVAQALRDRGWTLMLMGRPESLSAAETLFCQAWELRSYTDPMFQFELAIEQAILGMHQRQMEAAHNWLEQSKRLLEQVSLEAIDHQRQLMRLDYYEAEVWYREGNYEQAKIVYQQVLHQAQISQWQQVEIYTLNWLADIALKQGNLNEAEDLLKHSLPIAQTQQDKRSIAFHKRSWAQLQQLTGNRVEFRQWAIEAKGGFEELGMYTEAQEVQAWLDGGTA